MNVRSQGHNSSVTTAEHLAFPSVWFWMGCAGILTCLMVGVLPLIIILITASLSSKMYSLESPWEDCALLGHMIHLRQFINHCLRSRCQKLLDALFDFSLIAWTLDISLPLPEALITLPLPEALIEGFLLVWCDCDTCIKLSQRSNARRPSIRNPAARDMISDSVELWDTEVCFLHISLQGRMFDF